MQILTNNNDYKYKIKNKKIFQHKVSNFLLIIRILLQKIKNNFNINNAHYLNNNS